MLKMFRDELKSLAWILWLVILAFVLLVFVDFGGAGPGGQTPTSAAFSVDGADVSVQDFQDAYRRTENIYRQIYRDQYTPELAKQIGLARQVVNGLIDSRLLAAEAYKLGVAVTDNEVQEAILEQPALSDDNGNFIGADQYVDLLRQNGLTPDVFEGQLREQLLTEKMRQILSGSVFISDQEVETAYRDTAEKAKIRFVRLPISEFASEAAADDSEVQAYFDQHSEEFRQPERRTVEYLKVDTQALRDSIEVDPADLRAYYQENLDRYTNDEQVRARHILLRVSDERTEEQARTELEQVRARIVGGEDFAEIATDLSDDTGSAERGGDLGFFGRGAMVPEFDQAAFGSEPGTLTEPIKTDFGYHLIEVMEQRPGGQQPFEEVESQIRGIVAAERSREVADAKAEELAGRLQGDSAAELATIADTESGVSRVETSAFGRDEAVPGIGRSTAFTVAAFELAEGAASEAVRIPGGWAILRMLSTEAPRIPDLAEVETEVRTALGDQKSRDLAKSRLAELRARLGVDLDLDQLAEELDVEVQESTEFGANGSIGSLGRSRAVEEAALAGAVGDFGGPFSHDAEEVVIEVTERQQFDAATFAEEKEATRTRLSSQRVGTLLGALLADRRSKAVVTYNEALLQNFDLFEDGSEAAPS